MGEEYASYTVFPGTYSIDSYAGSDWFEAEPSTVEVVLGEVTLADPPAEPQPSEELKAECEGAMDEWLDECMASTEPEPAGCPQTAYVYGEVRDLSWELTTPPTVDWSYIQPTFPLSLNSTDGVATATYEEDQSYGYGPKQWTEGAEESSLYIAITVEESGGELSVEFEG